METVGTQLRMVFAVPLAIFTMLFGAVVFVGLTAHGWLATAALWFVSGLLLWCIDRWLPGMVVFRSKMPFVIGYFGLLGTVVFSIVGLAYVGPMEYLAHVLDGE